MAEDSGHTYPVDIGNCLAPLIRMESAEDKDENDKVYTILGQAWGQEVRRQIPDRSFNTADGWGLVQGVTLGADERSES